MKNKQFHIVNCSVIPVINLNDFVNDLISGHGNPVGRLMFEEIEQFEKEADGVLNCKDLSEDGLCIWRFSDKLVLEEKINPDFIYNRLAVYHTGNSRYYEADEAKDLNMDLIEDAAKIAIQAVQNKDIYDLANAMDLSFSAQIESGAMAHIEDIGYNFLAKKYCGEGNSGHMLYLFESQKDCNYFVRNMQNSIKVQPYFGKN